MASATSPLRNQTSTCVIRHIAGSPLSRYLRHSRAKTFPSQEPMAISLRAKRHPTAILSHFHVPKSRRPHHPPLPKSRSPHHPPLPKSRRPHHPPPAPSAPRCPVWLLLYRFPSRYPAVPANILRRTTPVPRVFSALPKFTRSQHTSMPRLAHGHLRRDFFNSHTGFLGEHSPVVSPSPSFKSKRGYLPSIIASIAIAHTTIPRALTTTLKTHTARAPTTPKKTNNALPTSMTSRHVQNSPSQAFYPTITPQAHLPPRLAALVRHKWQHFQSRIRL